MSAETNRAPAPGSNGGHSGRAGTSKIPQNPATPWLRQLGCPAGCLLDDRGRDVHECGVGEPLPTLPTPGPRDRGGRDLTIQQRDAIAVRWLERRWVA